MDLISYETIRAVHRVEKEEQLQKLPENFFESVRSWLSHKQKNSDSVSLLEVHNAKKLLDDILKRRERKIILSAMRTMRGEVPPVNLTDSERRFFDEIVVLMKAHRQETQEKMMGYAEVVESKIDEIKKTMADIRPSEIVEESVIKEPVVEESVVEEPETVEIGKPEEIINNTSKKFLKILSDIPKFVGSDMETYGPFNKGEMANLPSNVAEILISREVAELMTD
ncbi:MAG: DNA replication complex GINS family protein [Candidatus Aenigmarchaeota archaeon]|nr:DNA replication complex GINS family protein [Candidatus Aenigmarchaeota archaeon]